jgi:exosome complex component RRP4
MNHKQRKIVIPSQFLGNIQEKKAGRGTFVEKGKIYSEIIGILNINSNYINVIPLKGIYEPVVDDFVIGIVIEAMSSSWLIDINAAYPALLHVNEVPWDVEFGETDRYLNYSDVIMAKILQVDKEKKLQVTLKDRNLHKEKRGYLINVEPQKIRRIIGKKGSMINLLKKYTKCRIFVGQNGRIWIDGDEDGINKVINSIKMIEDEALSFGLTNKIEQILRINTKEVH